MVSLYEYGHELRMRFRDTLSTLDTTFRFFIGHRLGRADAFAHRYPTALGTTRQEQLRMLPESTTAYHGWLEAHGRHEKRARGDLFVGSAVGCVDSCPPALRDWLRGCKNHGEVLRRAQTRCGRVRTARSNATRSGWLMSTGVMLAERCIVS